MTEPPSARSSSRAAISARPPAQIRDDPDAIERDAELCEIADERTCRRRAEQIRFQHDDETGSTRDERT